jgi:hypothetical protein
MYLCSFDERPDAGKIPEIIVNPFEAPLLAGGEVLVEAEDLPAGPQERARRGEADAARRAGDERRAQSPSRA